MSALTLTTPVQFLRGVGPKLAQRLAKLSIHTLHDLLLHFPVRYVDRRSMAKTGELTPGPQRVVCARVVTAAKTMMPRSRRALYEVLFDDGSGPVRAVWFHFYEQTMQRKFTPGTWMLIAGDCTAFGHRVQFTHPDVEVVDGPDAPFAHGRIVPIYPLTEGIAQQRMRDFVMHVVEVCGPQLTEILDHALLADATLTRAAAIHALHAPAPETDIALLNTRRSPAHLRLIDEEFVLMQLGLALQRKSAQAEHAPCIPWNAAAHADLLAALPFTLTAGQTRAIAEITADVARAIPMQRLVQGDVGSGKTVVAAAALAQAARAGLQIAFMAPTEILAEQHARTLAPWLDRLKIPHAVLLGKTAAKVRTAIAARLASGELSLLLGTHALLESDVTFAQLGLVIIDEQHRFGVQQRLRLRSKGEAPHLLALSATPIPRSLAMSYFGDLDCSIVRERPAGRQPILTKHYRERDREKLYAGMRKELARGRQVYVVYPLVAESEKSDLRDATSMAAALTQEFAPEFSVALLHGKMRGDEKENIMTAFSRGAIHILATTSVVEVGVDVPNASVMAIEHAERFGLSQLHQLRGRVGRGSHASYCVLMTPDFVGEDAYARVKILCDTDDGFRIAEEDLRIRGPGEILGTRQSGVPQLKLANLIEDVALLETARERAQRFLAHDPDLRAHPTLRAAVIAYWGERLQLASAG